MPPSPSNRPAISAVAITSGAMKPITAATHMGSEAGPTAAATDSQRRDRVMATA